MPGKCEITIADETWELKPLRGLKSVKLMPEVISIGAELLWNAQDGGFPLGDFFLSGQEMAVDLTVALRAIKFVSDTLGKRYDDIALRIIPFLLQKEPQWLWENGNPREIVQAIWDAIKFHVETSFGGDVIEALKKSIAAEGDEAAETSSTQPEA